MFEPGSPERCPLFDEKLSNDRFYRRSPIERRDLKRTIGMMLGSKKRLLRNDRHLFPFYRIKFSRTRKRSCTFNRMIHQVTILMAHFANQTPGLSGLISFAAKPVPPFARIHGKHVRKPHHVRHRVSSAHVAHVRVRGKMSTAISSASRIHGRLISLPGPGLIVIAVLCSRRPR